MLHSMGRLKLIASHVSMALSAFALISARGSAQVRGADELRPPIATISVPNERAISLRRNPTLLARRPSPFAARNTSTCLPVSVYDGFEAPTLSNLWQTILLAPGALKLQSSIVHAGHRAAGITLRAHDRFEPGINGDRDSERDELVEAKALVTRTEDDCAYEYSFSMFFPTTFPIVPTRLVIAQWKQYCPDQLKMLNGSRIAAKGNRVCSNDSPILAIRYMSNALSLTQDINKKHTVLYERKGEFLNRWLDFEFKVRFSPRPAGNIQA